MASDSSGNYFVILWIIRISCSHPTTGSTDCCYRFAIYFYTAFRGDGYLKLWSLPLWLTPTKLSAFCLVMGPGNMMPLSCPDKVWHILVSEGNVPTKAFLAKMIQKKLSCKQKSNWLNINKSLHDNHNIYLLDWKTKKSTVKGFGKSMHLEDPMALAEVWTWSANSALVHCSRNTINTITSANTITLTDLNLASVHCCTMLSPWLMIYENDKYLSHNIWFRSSPILQPDDFTASSWVYSHANDTARVPRTTQHLTKLSTIGFNPTQVGCWSWFGSMRANNSNDSTCILALPCIVGCVWAVIRCPSLHWIDWWKLYVAQQQDNRMLWGYNVWQAAGHIKSSNKLQWWYSGPRD